MKSDVVNREILEADWLNMEVHFDNDGGLFPTMELIKLITYFNNIYEISRLAYDDKYSDFDFTDSRYYIGPKFKSYLDKEDQPYIHRLDYGSLIVEILFNYTIPLLGAIGTLIYVYDRFLNKKNENVQVIVDQAVRAAFERERLDREQLLGKLEMRNALN